MMQEPLTVKKRKVSKKFGEALDRLILDMLEAGWKCGAPCDETEHLDGEIVEKLVCYSCGGKLHYEPFHRGSRLDGERCEYQPYTVCMECGQVREF